MYVQQTNLEADGARGILMFLLGWGTRIAVASATRHVQGFSGLTNCALRRYQVE